MPLLYTITRTTCIVGAFPLRVPWLYAWFLIPVSFHPENLLLFLEVKAPAETLYTPGGVQDTLLTREERMTL